MGNLAIRCEVCGLTNNFYDDKYVYVEKTALVGGFNVCICNKCRNEFHEWYNTHTGLDEYRTYVKKWNIARITEDKKALSKCYEIGQLVEMKMFSITKAWIESHPKLDWNKNDQKVLEAPDSETST